MEEEVAKDLGEPHINNPDDERVIRVVNATGATCSEDFESENSDEAGVENKNVIFEEIDSGPAAAMDGYHCEQVCLKDHDVRFGQVHGSSMGSNGALISDNSGLHPNYVSSDIDFPLVGMDHDPSSLGPWPDEYMGYAMKQSPSATSLDEMVYADSGYSANPPQKVESRATMPNVSPELLHLVDSVIMGKPESLDKLKNIVSGHENFESGEEMDSIAYLVVDSLLATMGGVESFEEDGENNPPSVMHNSRAAIVAGELIPWLPWAGDGANFMSPRTRMVRGLLAILRACTRNRAMCSMAGLLQVLLVSAQKIFLTEVASSDLMRWDETPLCYCIQYLAGHSLSVIDLHRWLQLIRRALTTVWASQLMFALEKAITGNESKGPACTFEFDGESSGLLGPRESNWPFTNGYAFATWIYIESFADTLNPATTVEAAASALAGKDTAHMPRLFSFFSADNQGMEAYFHAQFLVVEYSTGKGKKTSLHFTHAFKPQCWYFIGVEHTCKQGMIGKADNEIRLYIDGSLYESQPFEFPRISKPLSFCCIGTNPPPILAGSQQQWRQCPLFAEMGPLYIFKDPIGPEKMAHLTSRGPDLLPSFVNGAGLPWLATNDQVRSMTEESYLLDTEIGGCVHLFFHPSLLSGRSCPDASPIGVSGALRRSAQFIGQVHVATRMRPVEALWALAYGGAMSLLPLAVSDVNRDSLEPRQGQLPLNLATSTLAASIFRIISVAIQQIKNNEEFSRSRGPEVLSRILDYLLQVLSSITTEMNGRMEDEELVAAVVSLCQSQRINCTLKVNLFRRLLLDLKVWSLCNYGLQKKLLSSLADMVFTESSVMRDAGAIQMLLDGCRRCYWIIREKNSVDNFSINEKVRPVGEINALIDELLVIIELLVGAAQPSFAADDVHCLLSFLVDCPQTNQVARVLHLIHRLVVQPNTTRAHIFGKAFIERGGVETLLILLQREAKAGNPKVLENSVENNVRMPCQENEPNNRDTVQERCQDEEESSLEVKELVSDEKHTYTATPDKYHRQGAGSTLSKTERKVPVSENPFANNVGGITIPISADNARNNVYNIDKEDGIVVAIIGLISALVAKGFLKFGSPPPTRLDTTSSLLGGGLNEGGGTMFEDKVSLLFFALQKAIQAAPNRLMSKNVSMALLGMSNNASSTDNELNFYDPSHRFEHLQLLLVLLRSLPYASRALQSRVLQDLLLLTCSHPENRDSLTKMEEWPEWILEILISNYEMDAGKASNSPSLGDIEDLVHNFLIIILEHSMRQKDGWKDIEATIHCAEWLSIIGGSSTGDRRTRREEYLPIFKRRLLGGLLDFATRELQAQTQIIAAAAAGVASGGLSPKEAKLEAENATQLSVALVENAIVMLMLVEDHLRLQSKVSRVSHTNWGTVSPISLMLPSNNYSNLSISIDGELSDVEGDCRSLSSDSDGVPLDVLASMADTNGELSAAVMERLTAAAAAEPYESVSCAFVSYGSCAKDLAEGWKYRSRLWYGVGLSSKTASLSGGGSGWDCWRPALKRDANGNWIELLLIQKSVAMLQALLLDESGHGGGLGIGGGSGTGMGAMAALYQLLDSDQPFLCMLRMVLLSMREEDDGEERILSRNINMEDATSKGLQGQEGNRMIFDSSPGLSRSPHSSLLWSVLSPLLNMDISESKRQRVLVASCVLFSEVWHAVSKDRKPLRKQYLEAIVPPFVAVLRRWRPLLANIHELATPDGLNPLVLDDCALATDSLPIEAALAMSSSVWAAAFASPPAAMALAMIAAGASGGDTPAPMSSSQLRRDKSLLERKTAKLFTFSSFQYTVDTAKSSPSVPKDKAAAKAAALAAARDLERNKKIGSGRGLSAVAMATSSQRRSTNDMERVRRWSLSEAMNIAWMECMHPVGSKSVYRKDFNALSYKFIAVLVTSFALARNMQRSEVDRCAQVEMIAQYHLSAGIRGWRKLIHYLIEMKCLFAPFSDHLCNPTQTFWKLDFMESSLRMRPCLRRNYSISDHFGTVSNHEDDAERNFEPKGFIDPSDAPAISVDAILMEAMNEDDEHDMDNLEDRVSNGDQQCNIHSSSSEVEENVEQVSAESPDIQLTSDQDLVQISCAVAPGYVPSHIDERILLELPSLMVCLLSTVQGTFQITTRRINFIVDKNPADGSNELNEVRHHGKDRSWPLSSLHQIYSRRYLLRRSALELFMVDRSNFLFDFGSSEGRRNASRTIVQAHPPQLDHKYLIAMQRPEQLLKRTQLMERWARREISNFEYLMLLNNLAGRSYNDITQYPVFPWILSDYSSKSLDLSDPSSYRDLSKPVGALNPGRLKKFQERYSTFVDPVIPKFHYGSHYSSIGTVLYYLVRVEPFTTLSFQLQGSKFGQTGRIFSDIAATWNGVLENMNDVKELVPELFYLPEVLTNRNSIDFGAQLGEKLDSVKLPPWAKNPVDFIYKHRMALESEHVSEHLHEWIDLIFGYKQRGKQAISANNVFFYFTYDGTINIDKISDPVQQRAVQDRIAYLGQTPSQLLTVPHMKRMPLADVLQLQTIFRNPGKVKSYSVPSPQKCNLPAAVIQASSDSVIIVDMHAPAAHVAHHTWQPNTPDGEGHPFLFQHGKSMADCSSGAFMRMFKGPVDSGSEWQFPQALAFPTTGIRGSAIVVITSDKEIITGGHADNSIKVISTDGAKTLETASGHCAPVTCLSISPDSNYLATGSRDTTILLWRIHRASSSSSTVPDAPSGGSTPTASTSSRTTLLEILADRSRRRIEGPIRVLRGHQKEITSCYVSSDFGIVVSCSHSSDVLLHSMRRGRLIRRLEGVEAHAVCLSSAGIVMTWNKLRYTISTFTLNGVLVASAKLPSSCTISCIEMSIDGNNVLIGVVKNDEESGSSDGYKNEGSHQNMDETDRRLDIIPPSICFLNLHTLEVYHKLKLAEGQDITALKLDKDGRNLLVSTADKQLIVFTDPMLKSSGSDGLSLQGKGQNFS
ncbi:hypothetical protein SAY87_024882 [Trapa incisa]|uniref:Uncharacterized protein n=1 Tax=Trapa incisa TaxID=236973 RepID=A0AAN7JFE2_9MYRT|nr:hypothetical protein SAY87_024882 [Trapa incisa]